MNKPFVVFAATTALLLLGVVGLVEAELNQPLEPTPEPPLSMADETLPTTGEDSRMSDSTMEHGGLPSAGLDTTADRRPGAHGPHGRPMGRLAQGADRMARHLDNATECSTNLTERLAEHEARMEERQAQMEERLLERYGNLSDVPANVTQFIQERQALMEERLAEMEARLGDPDNGTGLPGEDRDPGALFPGQGRMGHPPRGPGRAGFPGGAGLGECLLEEIDLPEETEV